MKADFVRFVFEECSNSKEILVSLFKGGTCFYFLLINSLKLWGNFKLVPVCLKDIFYLQLEHQSAISIDCCQLSWVTWSERSFLCYIFTTLKPTLGFIIPCGLFYQWCINHSNWFSRPNRFNLHLGLLICALAWKRFQIKKRNGPFTLSVSMNAAMSISS